MPRSGRRESRRSKRKKRRGRREVATVSILLPLQYAYFRRILRGVRTYRPAGATWRLAVGTPAKKPQWFRWMAKQQGVSGIITLLWQEDWIPDVEDCPVPIVNVSGRAEKVINRSVLPDNRKIGELAATHLLERGFRHFAYAGHPELGHSLSRRKAFAEAVEAAGHSLQPLRGQQDVAEWLRRLPRPLGIFAENDQTGFRLVRNCLAAGLRVPEDAGVIGVDNDDLLCDTADVPLTSIDPAAEQVGFQAAHLLDRLMQGEPAPSSPFVVPPAGVVPRTSTDTLAIEDADLAAAVRMIRDHACDPIHVGDVVEATDLSRRTLETRFRKYFGRTLHQEIRRVQFERATQLLTETDLRVPEIAYRCGFRYPTRFTETFSKGFGMPPTAYRQKHGRTLGTREGE